MSAAYERVTCTACDGTGREVVHPPAPDGRTCDTRCRECQGYGGFRVYPEPPPLPPPAEPAPAPTMDADEAKEAYVFEGARVPGFAREYDRAMDDEDERRQRGG